MFSHSLASLSNTFLLLIWKFEEWSIIELESWEAHAYYVSFHTSLLFVSESFEGIAVIGMEGPHPRPSGSVGLR